MLLGDLEKRGLIQPPPFLADNTMYLTITGSHAYGVADTSVKKSRIADYDHVGICIPPKEYVLPNHRGSIPGFGEPVKPFTGWEVSHIIDESARKEYDFKVYSIVHFFEMLRQNNPNIIEALYTPVWCVVHCSNVGKMIRDNRKMFLSKLAWKKFRNYAWGQFHKMNTKKPEGKRKEIVDEKGYDVKFAYNILRLMSDVEQILLEGDIDLQKDNEVMKSVRRGDWKIEEIRNWMIEKDKVLESAYPSCKLPEKPSEDKMLDLLVQCLEEHYGTISNYLSVADWSVKALREIDEILIKHRPKLYEQKTEKPWWKLW